MINLKKNFSFQCSSASRKFLNSRFSSAVCASSGAFQCSSASRKFLNERGRCARSQPNRCFSALQRAENSSMYSTCAGFGSSACVSVLFSEPKIPQSNGDNPRLRIAVWFQCSSASRKFLNPGRWRSRRIGASVSVLFSEPKIPQSARALLRRALADRFSALQRAENSSMRSWTRHNRRSWTVSVLFSEPKIPQFRVGGDRPHRPGAVSVLFSEPKIPQSVTDIIELLAGLGFSALQRAENSSIVDPSARRALCSKFQCSSASRKFLNSAS